MNKKYQLFMLTIYIFHKTITYLYWEIERETKLYMVLLKEQ